MQINIDEFSLKESNATLMKYHLELRTQTFNSTKRQKYNYSSDIKVMQSL